MARCGCAGSACNCLINGGLYIAVTGSGTLADPYVISSDGVDISDALRFIDTPTVNFTVTGSGTDVNPWQVTADITAKLDQLIDVSAPTPNSGEVLTWNGLGWVNAPGVTAAVGAITVGSSMSGDGSIGNPLEVDLQVADPQYQILGNGTTATPLTSSLYIGTGTVHPTDDITAYPIGISRAYISQTGNADGWPSNTGNIVTIKTNNTTCWQYWYPYSTLINVQARTWSASSASWSPWHGMGGPSLPNRMAAGGIMMQPPAGGGTASAAVVYPAGRFVPPAVDGTMRVQVSQISAFPSQGNVSWRDTDYDANGAPTGFTMYFYRQNTQLTMCQWLAEQGLEPPS